MTGIFTNRTEQKNLDNKPENLEMLDYINVYSGKTKIKSINELEYIKGKFYVMFGKRCNCSSKSANGSVEGIIDLSGLRKMVKIQQPKF
jgi:glutamine cyclotransferase